jgi:hypothetical protein
MLNVRWNEMNLDLINLEYVFYTLKHAAEEFVIDWPRRWAVRYIEEIKWGIDSQKYASAWPYKKYSRRYGIWKTRRRPSNRNKFWVLDGDLYQAIAIRQVGDNTWFGGVDAGIKDAGGKSWFSSVGGVARGPAKEIAWYGWIMERGRDWTMDSGGQAERPLFEPTLLDMIPQLTAEFGNKFETTFEGLWGEWGKK